MENDVFDTYLKQIRRTPLLTAEQETAAVRLLEQSRHRLRWKLLGYFHVLHGAIRLIEQAASGESRLERIFELDVRNMSKKRDVAKQLSSTLSQARALHDDSAHDFRAWLRHRQSRSTLRRHLQLRQALMALVEQLDIRLERLKELRLEVTQMPDQVAVYHHLQSPCCCLGLETPKRYLRWRSEVGKAMDRYDRAKNSLVAANLPLVISVAKRHCRSNQDTLDLVQEGNLGLMRAVEKFRSSYRGKFSTYAVWWIRQAMLKSSHQNRLVRLSPDAATKGRQVEKCKQALSHEIGHQPTMAELAAALRVDEQSVERINTWLGPMHDLDGSAGRQPMLSQMLYEDCLLEQTDQLRTQLRRVMSTLDERESRVIAMRYGLDSKRKHTLVEVSRVLGISRSRVSQIEQAALGKLRNQWPPAYTRPAVNQQVMTGQHVSSTI